MATANASGATKAEVDPISLGVVGKHEKMYHDPQTHRESQSKPNQIAWGLVYGPNGFALGPANAYNHDHERSDKQRTKSDGQYSQSHRDCRCRCPDVSWTE